MRKIMNQAVLFTKPLHHLGLSLTPEELDRRTRAFLEEAGFSLVLSTSLTGTDLADRDTIREHYRMYSRAACVETADELQLSEPGKARFESAFGISWQDGAGKVFGSPELQQRKGISSHELYLLWNEEFSNGRTAKLQAGVILARLDNLDCYCINAFYPSMEENFYHPDTRIFYHVIEFDPERIPWARFRKEVLGATDAGRAAAGSFRGQLYAAHPVGFAGRDDFVHGSAGPLEGLVERIIHEHGFDMGANPVGRYLLERGITLDQFRTWKSGLTIAELGNLFDATEEKDTEEAVAYLAEVEFS